MGKEVSGKSLLIASGCSYTDQDQPFYLDNDIITWPELVAAELGVEYLNVACGGSPNDYICNSIIDAVLDNLDRDITVMVLWTSSNRWIPCQGPIRLWQKDWLVTYQLRCMWRLNEFCKQRNIPIYQGHSTSPLASLKHIEYNTYDFDSKDCLLKNKYFSPEYFGPQNPWSNMPWMANEPYMIPGDGHPNQKAQEWIADYFLITYQGRDFDTPLDNSNYIEFVYD